MEDLNWKTGYGPAASATQIDPMGNPEEGDMEFWKSLLANHSLRSRFIRDLEIQSIGTRSAEDLAHRDRGEEILPRGWAKGKAGAF
jgi:hypothetical protein